MTAAAILGLIQHPTSPQYVVLAKGVAAQAGNQISAAEPARHPSDPNYARSYPDGDVAANIIGFTGTNSQGILTGGAGLEQEDNALLAGRAGSEQVQIGTNGQQIPLAGSNDTPVVNGSDLRLTIVPALQYAAEQACAAQVAKTDASNCTVVIIQPKTGHVLAMAQWPTYDPTTITNAAQATDIAVQDVFQPGSTAKVITAAAAFERGGQTPMSAYNIPYPIVRGRPAHPGRGVGARRAVHHRRHHRALLQRRHLPGRRARPRAGPVRLPAGVRPRPADRHRAAGGERGPPAPGLAVGRGHQVHAGVRPGRGGDRAPDGRGLRDDRERRRPGPARR